MQNISIVIPVYNSEQWITPTLQHIEAAIKASHFVAEVIIVDDGSTDRSLATAQAYKPATDRLTIKVLAQTNKGRYLARKAGVEAAKSDQILFIDSRVYIDEGSLAYLETKLKGNPRQVWNGHVHVDKEGNPFARFWDAIVCIAWRRYFGNPRETSFGLEDFDYYPKGTGFFFVPRDLLLEGMAIFEKETNDIAFSSDDTLLIRFIASRQRIHLSPQFSCLYHGRSTFKKFLAHAYNRGQFFVDGFLRRGNRFFAPLLMFLAFCILLVVALALMPIKTIVALFGLVVLGVLGLFGSALFLRVYYKDALALAGLAPMFAVVYGAGIWRGVLRKLGIRG